MKKRANKSYQAIRKTSTIKLILLSFITFGIYWYIWLWKLITDVNKLYPQKRIHRLGWFEVLISLDIASYIMQYKGIQINLILNAADLSWIIVQLILAIQILKNIENYVKHEFSINIKHSTIGWLFFGCFYINYKINRLAYTIRKEIRRQIKQIKNTSEK